MQRRYFAIAAVLTLAAATFVHPAQAIEFITVTSTADSGPGTLRQAILDANLSVGEATMIDFGPTVFSGRIRLESPLPRILDPDTTIDGSGSEFGLDGSLLVGDFDRGFRVRASGTVIRGLTIQDFPNDGIRIRPNGNGRTVTGVIIQNNTIIRNEDGLRVTGQGHDNVVGVTISGNTFRDNLDDGIVVFGSSSAVTSGNNTIDVTIDGNTIDGSKGENNPGLTGDGIRIFSGVGNSLSNIVTAVISNNDINASFDQGMVVKGAGGNGQTSGNTLNVNIFGNVVQDSGLAGSGTGIALTGGHRSGESGGTDNVVIFTVSNNTVFGSTQHGIAILGGNAGQEPRGGFHNVSGSVSNNIVRGNLRNGIRVSGGRTDGSVVTVVVEDNAIRNNGEHGINVIGGQLGSNNNVVTNITIQRNITRVNGLNGLNVSVGSGTGNVVSLAEITDNTSVSNVQDGIRIASGIPGNGATPISGNTASQNEQDGIDIDSGGYNLFNNTADRNTVDGINAGVGINNDGGGNTAKNNLKCNSPDFCF